MGSHLIWFILMKKENLETDRHTKRMTCEDAVSRCLPISQGERPGTSSSITGLRGN